MTIAQITSLAPQGSFNSANGLMFKWGITLSDGTFGEANSKNQPPPYQVGDQVGYDVTGDFQGTPKLKITGPKKLAELRGQAPTQQPQQWQQQPAQPPPQQRRQQQAPPAYNQAPPAQQSAPAAQELPVLHHGATVGGVIKISVQLHAKDGTIDMQKVFATASDLLRMHWKMERGILAPKISARPTNGNGHHAPAPEADFDEVPVGQPPTPAPSPTSYRQQAAPAPAPAGRPAPGPDGQAYDTTLVDDDVPF